MAIAVWLLYISAFLLGSRLGDIVERKFFLSETQGAVVSIILGCLTYTACAFIVLLVLKGVGAV